MSRLQKHSPQHQRKFADGVVLAKAQIIEIERVVRGESMENIFADRQKFCDLRCGLLDLSQGSTKSLNNQIRLCSQIIGDQAHFGVGKGVQCRSALS